MLLLQLPIQLRMTMIIGLGRTPRWQDTTQAGQGRPPLFALRNNARRAKPILSCCALLLLLLLPPGRVAFSAQFTFRSSSPFASFRAPFLSRLGDL